MEHKDIIKPKDIKIRKKWHRKPETQIEPAKKGPYNRAHIKQELRDILQEELDFDSENY